MLMSNENIVNFEKKLMQDAGLASELKERAEAYSGDPADERATFEEVVAPVAEKAGVPFTFDELVALKDGHAGELSEEELEQVSGGGICFIIGGSNGKEAEGSNDVCDGALSEYHACWYVGVGVILVNFA